MIAADIYDKPLPLDWEEWWEMWKVWEAAHRDDLGSTSSRFPGVNFMADAKLGTWLYKGVLIELSECRFLESRFIGFTFWRDGQRRTASPAYSLKELDERLAQIVAGEEV